MVKQRSPTHSLAGNSTRAGSEVFSYSNASRQSINGWHPARACVHRVVGTRHSVSRRRGGLGVYNNDPVGSTSERKCSRLQFISRAPPREILSARRADNLLPPPSFYTHTRARSLPQPDFQKAVQKMCFHFYYLLAFNTKNKPTHSSQPLSSEKTHLLSCRTLNQQCLSSYS